MTKFTYGATVVQFNRDPARGISLEAKRFQPSGRYSTGQFVCYDKSTISRNSYPINFVRLSSSVMAALIAFVATTVDGGRLPFTWTDHAGTDRTARLAAGSLSYRQTGPDQHTVSLTLEVDQ